MKGIYQKIIASWPGGSGNMSTVAWTAGIAALAFVAFAITASAQRSHGPGVSDSEIKIGHLAPYSGPASSYSTIGKTQAAYFKKINEEGGVNGRKITFVSYDDGYSAPKAVEQARKLVEEDEVLLIFNPLGTASNTAIQKYMNNRQVPHLFIGSGAAKFGDPKNFPWTMGLQPTFQSEGRVYAKYILEKLPNAKIAILWQNDDAGKEYVKGVRDGLGDKTGTIVADASYDVTDPTIDSQIVTLKNSGADVFLSAAAPKATAQAIKKIAELGWKPTYFVSSPSASIQILKTAGLENAKGLISVSYFKDPTDPAWKDDAGIKAWGAFMDKYYPDGDKLNANNVFGYLAAQALVHVLKQCDSDLSRENVMKQAASIKDFTTNIMTPGIKMNTGPNDYHPIKQMQLMQFDGERWQPFGNIIEGQVRD